MNNQNNNFGHHSGYMSGYQQFHQQPPQQQPHQQFLPQLNYPQYIADQYQQPVAHNLAFPPPNNFQYSQAPPLPPDVKPPEPGKNNRGNFHNVNHRGQNKQQNWGPPRGGGNHRGGNRSGQFSSGGFQQNDNYFPNVRENHQNQGGQGQNRNKNRNQNFNQNQQHRQQYNEPPKIEPKPFTNAPPAPAPVTQNNDPPKAVSVPLTQEEVEFDEQFQKWEDEFAKWKQANVNHPDKDAYKRYEQQFEAVRDQLLQRRNEMQKKKKQEQANSIKTAEQEKFESQWKAGDPQNETKKTDPTPSTSKVSMPPPPSDPKEYTNDRYDEIEHFESLEAAGSFNSARNWPLRNDGIPCLDLAPEQPKPKPVDEIPIIDLDPEENLGEPTEPPPLATFKTDNRYLTPIEEILAEPGRSKRAEKILILIRGAPGSGKTYLANLILEKEKSLGNNRSKILRIESIDIKTDRAMLDKYQDKLLHQLREISRQAFFNFVIVEVEGGKLLYFNKYSQVAQSVGNFKCYVIQIVQTVETCIKYNRNRRSRRDIEEAVSEIDKYPAPARNILLDPTWLLTNKRQSAIPMIETEPVAPPAINDLASNLAQLLQNKNVMDLLQSQLSNQTQNQNQPKPLMSEVVAPPQNRPNQPQNRPNQQMNQQNSNYPPPLMQSQPNLNQQSSSFPQSQSNSFPQSQSNSFPQSQSNSFKPMNQQNSNYPPPLMISQQNSNFPLPPANNFNNFSQSNQFPTNSRPTDQPGTSNENFGYNNFSQPPPVSNEPSYNECPTFTPVKIIDYKHVHIPTLAEQLLEFRVFRVIDYKHRTTPQLREFVREIDTEKIIARRKSIALRKKILEYLKSAERPEDTVSNPKYPRNWEEIKRERPPTTNKRKKKLTAKIKRILAQKESEWMTVGYSRDKKMDLEEISSDDDGDDFEEPQAKVQKFDAPKFNAPKFVDPFVNNRRTVPSFNASNHTNVVDIKNLLWRPDRATRPHWILIILRGAPGSGKSHLTQLIKRKELEMVSSGPRIISINDYFEEEDVKDSATDVKMMETYLNQMVKFVEKTIKERRYEMIIIDAENCDLTFYKQFHQAGTSKGFTTFTIEMNQTLEFCLGQNIHQRSSSDIKSAIEMFEKNPTPSDHTLLIPTILYNEYSCLENPALVKEPIVIESEETSSSNFSDPASNVVDKWEKLSDTVEKLLTFDEGRSVVNIRTILDEPWRSNRGEKVLIILRGASGVGKSYLAGLIRSKEAAVNADGVLLLSIADFFIDPSTMTFKYDESKLAENIEKMSETLKSIISEGSHSFILIDAKNENIEDYKRFIDTGTSNGFKCYLIDFYKAESIFQKVDYENKSTSENKKILLSILNSSPENVSLLNPLALYKKDSAEVLPLKSALRTSENPLFPAVLVSPQKATIVKKDPPKIPEFNWHNREITDAHAIFEEPGRSSRPEKIIIVLRGAPGSGKSFLADLIQQKEAKRGNRTQFKTISLDAFVDEDFQELKLNEYMENLIESLNEIMQSSKFKFIVVDADCCDLLFYNRIYEIAQHHNFTGYTIELNQDDSKCIQQCDHKRDVAIMAKNKFMADNPTPNDHPLLDPEYLYEENCFEGGDDEMEMFEGIESDEEEEVSANFGPLRKTTIESKWDDDGDAPDIVIERLDGTRNKSFEHLTMAAYLQTDDEWTMRPSTSGKKRVRWADIEEKKKQERMREIGFIVGQTESDWKRMTDTTDGKSALEKTKYIEPRKK